MKQSKILINFICAVLIFSFVTYNYFLMGLYMKYAVGDIFFNTLLASLSELLAYLSVFIIFKFVRLKLILVVFSSMSIIFGVLLMLDLPIWIATVCLFLTKFSSQVIFPCSHYLNNANLFNPLLIPFLYGVGNLVAKSLTILAPQIVELQEPIPIISFLLTSFGIFV